MEQEVVSVWAGTHGKMDDLPLGDVLPFEHALLDYLEHSTDILKTIRETENFTPDTEAALDEAVEAFRETYVTKAGKPLVVKKSSTRKPVPVEQEKIIAKPTSPRTIRPSTRWLEKRSSHGSQLALKAGSPLRDRWRRFSTPRR